MSCCCNLYHKSKQNKTKRSANKKSIIKSLWSLHFHEQEFEMVGFFICHFLCSSRCSRFLSVLF